MASIPDPNDPGTARTVEIGKSSVGHPSLLELCAACASAAERSEACRLDPGLLAGGWGPGTARIEAHGLLLRKADFQIAGLKAADTGSCHKQVADGLPASCQLGAPLSMRHMQL